MPFVPALCLQPSAAIGRAIFKQSSDVLFETGLVVFGNQHVIPLKPVHERTELALGMHRVQAQDASFDDWDAQQRFERADLVLFLLDIAMPEHRPSGNLITTELMDWMRLLSGGPQRFASPSPRARDRRGLQGSRGGWVPLHSDCELPIAQRRRLAGRRVA